MIRVFLVRFFIPVCILLLTPQGISAQAVNASKPQARNAELLAVRLLGEKDIPRDTQPRWCYEGEPKFLFLQGSSLIGSDIQFNTAVLANFDRPADIVSLQCSDDGKVISFMSARHDRLYIYQNDRLSTYELAPPPLGNIRYGSLMSPDGSIFAVLGNLTHLTGPKILEMKRIVRVDSFDVFWTKDYLFSRSASSNFSIKSLPSLQQSTIWKQSTNALIDGIYECGDRALFMLQSDRADNKGLTNVNVTSGSAVKVTKGSTKIDNVGAVESGQSGCLLSTIKDNEIKVSIVDQLILLHGSKTKKADLAAFMFLNHRFSLSKQMEYVVSFQSNLMKQRSGGRIVILGVGR